MSEDLKSWVRKHQDELGFVSEYGRTATIRAQAMALLKVVEGGMKLE